MIRRRPLTCPELVELVTDYLEGALSRRDRRRFESHLATCEGCQIHLDQIRATRGIAGRLAEEDVAPEALEELLTAFQGWKSARKDSNP